MCGVGDESSGEDEPEDQRLADIKHHLVAVPSGKTSSAIEALPISLMTQQQQTGTCSRPQSTICKKLGIVLACNLLLLQVLQAPDH